MSTNVPAIQFTPTGLVLPTDAAILAGVRADIDAVFGGGLNPGLSTPQGQLASSETAIISDKNSQIALLVNQVDPQFSAGRMQDAIGNIYFMTRYPSLSTAVVCTVVGLAGTVIPVNAQARASDGELYVCTGAVMIPAGGSISANFQSVNSGPITCLAGTLTTIYQAIPGWDTITNPADGVIGRNVETPSEFEYRREQSVAANAVNSLASIYGALFNVTNVIDVYCTENFTDAPITVGGVTLAAHSLWACVAGGASADIAQAIYLKKSIGCNYNGNNAYTVYDTSGYEIPYPQYVVNWKTATPTPIKFAVSVANNAYLPANAVALIKAAIVAAFTGGDGGPVARIGSSLYASRYYAPVIAVATPGTAIEILSLLLGISSANLSALTMDIDKIPTVSAGDITVTLV